LVARLKWPLQLISGYSGGVWILAVSGRAGRASAGVLGQELHAAASRGDLRIVLDLAGLDYISGAALQTVDSAEVRLKNGGGRLVLCCVTPAVRVTLDIAGFGHRFVIEPTREAAVARAKLLG
jgi:anti-anti-sigma factor